MDFKTETWKLADLRPHPQNFQQHPEDQLEHLVASLDEHGVYKNVVIAEDGTILAGHGVVEAARRAGLDSIPAVRLAIKPDSPAAMRVLIGDNRISQLAQVDDRLLAELLRAIKDEDETGLLGTGFDLQKLAALVMVTRPASEIPDFDAAAEWTGMPDYEQQPDVLKLVVSFETEEDRQDLASRLSIKLGGAQRESIWWPPKKRDHLIHEKYE